MFRGGFIEGPLEKFVTVVTTVLSSSRGCSSVGRQKVVGVGAVSR